MIVCDFMLDNLVRIVHNSNPDRGENRTGQINLLPITIQGLPSDSKIVSEWHDSKICDESENCQCKIDRQLTPTDIRTSLFELDVVECDAMNRFIGLSTWGNTYIWEAFNRFEEYQEWCKKK